MTSESNMSHELPPSNERHEQLIAKYFIPNMGDNSIAGSQLSLILDRLDRNGGLNAEDKKYIRDKGLFDFSEFVKQLEETGKPDFGIIRRKFEQEHKRRRRKELWEKYDISYVERSDMHRIMSILERIDLGSRMDDNDAVWLATQGYFSPALRRRFHMNEAGYYVSLFRKGRDPRNAVNASSHFRKAKAPAESLKLLGEIPFDIQKDKRLTSALYTTQGGALRDMKKLDQALQSAGKAHTADPGSFHPCTLLGALSYELGNFTLGSEWFAKAIERGAEQKNVDQELRSILMRSDKAGKEGLKRHLLSVDPHLYAWVKKLN